MSITTSLGQCQMQCRLNVASVKAKGHVWRILKEGRTMATYTPSLNVVCESCITRSKRDYAFPPPGDVWNGELAMEGSVKEH